MATIANVTTPPTPTFIVLATTVLPTSIGNPTFTEPITSIVMASGTPGASSIVITGAALTQATSQQTSQIAGSSSASQSTSSWIFDGHQNPATLISSQSNTKASLNMSQIIGIAVGAGGIVLLIIGMLIFWYCRRKKRLQRRRSNRWSMHVPQMPPKSHYGADPHSRISSIPEVTSTIRDHGQRYYSIAPMQEKRRSFWRKSIKPEDIGIAVSPEVDTESPNSYKSQQSTSVLIPKPLPALPARALWPSPLKLSASKQRRQVNDRTSSVSTIFDEETGEEQNIAHEHENYSLPLTMTQIPTTTSSRPRPPSLQLSLQPSVRTPIKSYRGNYYHHMPLTPIYDNGNVLQRPLRPNQSNTWPIQQPVVREAISGDDPTSQVHSSSSMSAGRNVLRKKIRTRPGILDQDVFTAQPLAVNAVPLPTAVSLPPPLPRKESEATEIDDGTSAGATDEHLNIPDCDTHSSQLGLSQLSNQTHHALSPERYQIADLRYPPIPHSKAALSQLEHVEESFRRIEKNSALQPTTSVSSHRHGSRSEADRSISPPATNKPISFRLSMVGQENQVPQAEIIVRNQGISAANGAALRETSKNVNRTTVLKQSTNEDFPGVGNQIDTKPKHNVVNKTIGLEIATRQGSPDSKVRIRPGKTRTGDLYLTVVD